MSSTVDNKSELILSDNTTDFSEDIYKNINIKPYSREADKIMTRIMNNKRIYNIK